MVLEVRSKMPRWPWNQAFAVSIFCTFLSLHHPTVTSVRKENHCMRHYYVETIRHPKKNCDKKNVLLARCEGYCGKSRTNPRVSFSPVLYQPFRHHCTCCKDTLSIMKAAALSCQGGEVVFATYRYILQCACQFCGSRLASDVV